MLAVDTSSLIAFFRGDPGLDVEAVDTAFDEKCAIFSPVVLTEMFSDYRLSAEVSKLLSALPRMDLKSGFWERAGVLRSSILKRGFKARLADALIAQNCIDHKIPLITRDDDFRHYVKAGGLILWSSL